MSATPKVSAAEPTPGRCGARRARAVGNSDGELFAVSRRCRHQLGDLSEGSTDADGTVGCCRCASRTPYAPAPRWWSGLRPVSVPLTPGDAG